MPRAKKATTKKTTRKTKTKSVALQAPAPVTTPTMVQSKPSYNRSLTYALIVLAIALLVYKLGPWLFPAVVDYRPVSRLEVWSRMEKSYGAQTLDDLVNEQILDRAIDEANIKVSQDKIDEQIKILETQFESTGGLDEALKQRGLSRRDLLEQVRTQLAVEELLKDKIVPTDEEVLAQYNSGAETLYQGKTFEEVKGGIAEELKQSKLRDAFLVWFAEVKKDVKVKSYGL